MLQLGSFNFRSLEAFFVNGLFFRSVGLRLAAVLALTLTGAALPHSSWAKFPRFDSAPLLTPEPTSFAQCPQFFVNGTPPAITTRPQLRELCYEAFAVLHWGITKTPVYVAQRLNRQLIEDADEKRAKRFFADARLPAASGLNWRTTRTRATAEATWLLQGICPRPQPWPRASAWPTWFPRTRSTTGAHGTRLSRTRGTMCGGPRGMPEEEFDP